MFSTCLFSLLLQHCIQNWYDPLLKLAVVVIRYKKVTYPVQPFHSQFFSGEGEVPEVGWSKTFDEVLFNSTSSGHYDIHLYM